MTSILDRPIWSALQTRHADLAEGGALARRYGHSVSLFASAADDSPESLQALASLPRDGEQMLLAQTEMAVPAGFAAVSSAALVQMILDRPLAEVADDRIEKLGWPDAAEMFELATLTRPGPFTLKSQALGSFWGIKADDGRLVAMAGERLKQPGYTELSGVCVHPDFRGRGYARLLSLFVSGRTQAAGEQPYLHCYATNATAIRLYESIGFHLRADLKVAVIARAE